MVYLMFESPKSHIVLVGIICSEYAKYLEKLDEFAKLHRKEYASETLKQYDLYHLHLEACKIYTNYCNSIYEFKSSLTDDIMLDVKYNDIIGFHLPDTFSTIYIQAIFDGECDINAEYSFFNGISIPIGGLPYGTVVFTPNKTYIIEGRELVLFTA